MLASIGIPSTTNGQEPQKRSDIYLASFKEILSNKSALACLTGDVLRAASFGAILYYGAAFFMQRFGASTNDASLIILAAALCYTLGNLIGGRFVNRIGRKLSTALTAFLAGLFTMFFVYIPDFWLSLTLNFTAAWFFGMVTTAANCLTLEQVPRYRGTMMSIDSAFVNLGYALGAAIGGLALILFNYEGLGSILGAIGIIASIVFYSLTTDPART